MFLVDFFDQAVLLVSDLIFQLRDLLLTLVFLLAPRDLLHSLVFLSDIQVRHGQVHLGFLLTFSRLFGGVDIPRLRRRGGMPLDEGKCFLGMGGARARAQARLRGDDDRKGRAEDALKYHRDDLVGVAFTTE
jgi:hypothetical protein